MTGIRTRQNVNRRSSSTRSTIASVRSTSASTRSTLALVAVSLALLLSSIAPPGYMAGSLENGWPVVLCPEGLPQGFLSGHHHHDHDSDDGASTGAHDLSLGAHCPLGGMLDASAVTVAVAIVDRPALSFDGVRQSYQAPQTRRPTEAHPTRAPPVRV